MPNMIAVITTNSNDSSPNNTRILDNSKVGKSVDRPAARTSEEFSNIVSRAASTSASVENRSSFRFRDRIDNSKESTSNESPDRPKFNVGENSEIPNTPPRYNPVVPPELSSNELLNYHNSDEFSESLPKGKETSAVDSGIAPDFPFKRTIVGALRRRRLPTHNTDQASTNKSDDISRPRFRRGKAKRAIRM